MIKEEAALQECGERLLPWIAYGDSAGLPYETMKAGAIAEHMRERVANGEDPHSLQPTTKNPYIDRQPTGGWSDDTILSLAVTKAIIQTQKHGGDVLDAVAVEHITAYGRYAEAFGPQKFGFGRSTIRSMERLASGRHWSESGEEGGLGNGVLMKLAPLAYFHAVSNLPSAESDKVVEQFARMTHDNAFSAMTARVHHDVLGWLLEGDANSRQMLLDAAVEIAKMAEYAYVGMDQTLKEPILSRRLGRMALKSNFGVLDAREVIRHNPKGGFDSIGTLGRAYGAFVLKASFPENVWQAVELGGDTDSIASIVAGMNALYPLTDLKEPSDIEQLRDINDLRNISRQFSLLKPTA